MEGFSSFRKRIYVSGGCFCVPDDQKNNTVRSQLEAFPKKIFKMKKSWKMWFFLVIMDVLWRSFLEEKYIFHFDLKLTQIVQDLKSSENQKKVFQVASNFAKWQFCE